MQHNSDTFIDIYFACVGNNTVIYTDINECTKKTHNCHKDADCTNTVGSFTCACKKGYSGDGRNCKGMFLFDVIFIQFFKLAIV